MNVAHIREGENDSLNFDLSRTEKLLMLAPDSFINSSCKSNSSNDSQQKVSLLYIIVVAKSNLLGQEVLVLYSGGYFGPNRINCQYHYVEVEFHGADPYVFATKTRSDRNFADKDYSCDETKMQIRKAVKP